MDADILTEQQNFNNIQSKSLRIAEMKINHLTDLNRQLYQQVQIFKKRALNLDEQIDALKQLKIGHESYDINRTSNQLIIIQNKELFYRCQQLLDQNQQLKIEKLLRQQIHEENIKQFHIIQEGYQNKIHQLNQTVQKKQNWIQERESLRKNDKTLNIPICENNNMKTFEECLLPYVKIIQQLFSNLRKIDPQLLHKKAFLDIQKVLQSQQNKNPQRNISKKTYLSEFKLNKEAIEQNKLFNQEKTFQQLYLNSYLLLQKTQNQLRFTKKQNIQLRIRQKTYKESYVKLQAQLKKLTDQVYDNTIKHTNQNQEKSQNLCQQKVNYKKELTSQTIQSNDGYNSDKAYQKQRCSSSLIWKQKHKSFNLQPEKVQNNIKTKTISKQDTQQKQKKQCSIDGIDAEFLQERAQDDDLSFSLTGDQFQRKLQTETIQNTNFHQSLRRKKAAQHFIQNLLFSQF